MWRGLPHSFLIISRMGTLLIAFFATELALSEADWVGDFDFEAAKLALDAYIPLSYPVYM